MGSTGFWFTVLAHSIRCAIRLNARFHNSTCKLLMGNKISFSPHIQFARKLHSFLEDSISSKGLNEGGADTQDELHHAFLTALWTTTWGLRIVLLLCRRLLLSRPYVGEINSPRHTGMQTADALMLCRPHWTYTRHDSEQWSGTIHCIAKNSLKANKREKSNKHFPRGCIELLP